MLGRGLVEFWPLDVWMRNASWNRESSFSYVANTFPVSPTRETPSSSEIWSGEAPTMTKTMTGKEVFETWLVYNPSTPGSDPTVGYPGRILRWGWMRVKSRNLQSEEKMRRGSRPRLGTCSLTKKRRCRWPRCSPRNGWSSCLHCSDRDPKIQLRWDGSSSTGAHLDEQSP